MNTIVQRLIGSIFTITLATLLSACGGGSSSNTSGPVNNAPTTTSQATQTASINLGNDLGTMISLSSTVSSLFTDIDGDALTYSLSANSLLRVNNGAIVTRRVLNAVDLGSHTISIIATDAGGLTANLPLSLSVAGFTAITNCDTASTSIDTDCTISLDSIAYIGIYNAKQLQDIGTNTVNLAGKYVLANDIDVDATISNFDPIGENTTANSFKGVFNGLGFEISGLSINRSIEAVGLFARNAGTITAVTLINPVVTGGSNVGALVGFNNVGSISAVYVIGGTITATTQGTGEAGGLVGINSGGSIANAYSSAKVSGINNAGGLVGSNAKTIRNAYATGKVAGSGINAGGLTGNNVSGAIIRNAYATGKVAGATNAGGLTGFNNAALVEKSYAIGTVTGTSNIGGLVGRSASGGSVSNSFWDTETTEQDNSPGGGTGLSTAAMQSTSGAITALNTDTSAWLLTARRYPLLRFLNADGTYGGLLNGQIVLPVTVPVARAEEIASAATVATWFVGIGSNATYAITRASSFTFTTAGVLQASSAFTNTDIGTQRLIVSADDGINTQSVEITVNITNP